MGSERFTDEEVRTMYINIYNLSNVYPTNLKIYPEIYRLSTLTLEEFKSILNGSNDDMSDGTADALSVLTDFIKVLEARGQLDNVQVSKILN